MAVEAESGQKVPGIITKPVEARSHGHHFAEPERLSPEKNYQNVVLLLTAFVCMTPISTLLSFATISEWSVQTKVCYQAVHITGTVRRLWWCVSCMTTGKIIGIAGYHSDVRESHKVKWRHSNIWSQCDLYATGQNGVLREVKWWRFVALFEWNWISWFKRMSVLSLLAKSANESVWNKISIA